MDLPLLDEHVAVISADREAVWRAVRQYAERLANSRHSLIGRALGTEPASGFRIAEQVDGDRIALEGRHRFASYRLVFETRDHGRSATELRVRSLADFPGVTGRAYRALLMGTHGHVLAVHHLIRTVRRLSGAPIGGPR